MPRSDTKSKVIEVLSTIPAFADLDALILDALAQAATQRYYDAGRVVYLEGELNSGVYIVQEGWLKSVKISAIGREQIFRFLGPGEVFNTARIFTDGLNQTTVEALEPAKVWVIQSDTIILLMDKYPSFGRVITQNLAEQVQHLMDLVENLSLLTVEARLARTFLEHSTSDVLNRRRWSTQAEMAARLGTVPDVLNRALRGLADEGLITIERHQIYIRDRAGLQRKAMLGE
ncbi:MAG: Crp/Fnr family transcriptional regulator [Anaerolineales bacterium]|nr:Crp/Fnr family transcriptional regulator [Chloroflexota bacterium]MBL6979606.1 Crp/Fnr family transcriptional regulator [Anaerolineales bacterium]